MLSISLMGSFLENLGFGTDQYRNHTVKSLLYRVASISQRYALESFIDRASADLVRSDLIQCIA
jgi:hypothetical protein